MKIVNAIFHDLDCLYSAKKPSRQNNEDMDSIGTREIGWQLVILLLLQWARNFTKTEILRIFI